MTNTFMLICCCVIIYLRCEIYITFYGFVENELIWRDVTGAGHFSAPNFSARGSSASLTPATQEEEERALDL